MDAPRRRRLDPGLLLASMAISLGLVLVVLGVRGSVTGREQQGLPPEIESVEPIRGATQVLRQSPVFVDLADGYTGVLVIDGLELPTVSLDSVGAIAPGGTQPAPGAQVSLPDAVLFEPGNSTLTYVPRQGGAVEQFANGRHQVTVIYWKVEESRERSLSFTWDFYAV